MRLRKRAPRPPLQTLVASQIQGKVGTVAAGATARAPWSEPDDPLLGLAPGERSDSAPSHAPQEADGDVAPEVVAGRAEGLERRIGQVMFYEEVV